MPEYIPPLQLPTGLAEQGVNLLAHKNDAWAALAQNLGNSFSDAINYRTDLKNKAAANQVDPNKVNAAVMALTGQQQPVQIGKNRTIGGNTTLGGPMSGPSGGQGKVIPQMPKLNQNESDLVQKIMAQKSTEQRQSTLETQKESGRTALEKLKESHQNELKSTQDKWSKGMEELKSKHAKELESLRSSDKTNGSGNKSNSEDDKKKLSAIKVQQKALSDEYKTTHPVIDYSRREEIEKKMAELGDEAKKIQNHSSSNDGKSHEELKKDIYGSQ